MVNAIKQTYQLLMEIPTLVSHFEIPNRCKFVKLSINTVDCRLESFLKSMNTVNSLLQYLLS